MQFRLREDVAAAGRDAGAFDRLRDVRGLEYELDFVTNRAQRTEQARAPAPACARRRPAGRGVVAPLTADRLAGEPLSRHGRMRGAQAGGRPRPCRR